MEISAVTLNGGTLYELKDSYSRYCSQELSTQFQEYISKSKKIEGLSSVNSLEPTDASTYEISYEFNKFLQVLKTKYLYELKDVEDLNPTEASTYDISEKFNIVLNILKNK